MGAKAPRIPDQIWDQHREEIIAFYLANPLERTMEHMMERYGFEARYSLYFLLARWIILESNAVYS